MTDLSSLAAEYSSLREQLAEVVPLRERLFATSDFGAKTTKALQEYNRTILFVLMKLGRDNTKFRRLLGDSFFSKDVIGKLLATESPHAKLLRSYEAFFVEIGRGVNPKLKALRRAVSNQTKIKDATLIIQIEGSLREIAGEIGKVLAPYQTLGTMVHQEVAGTITDQETNHPERFVHDPRTSLWVLVQMIADIQVFLTAAQGIADQRETHDTPENGRATATAQNDDAVIKRTEAGYLLHDVQLHNGWWDLEWSAEVLDLGRFHIQDEWCKKSFLYNGRFVLPSGPEYAATILWLYEHRAHPLVTEFKTGLLRDMMNRPLLTSTRFTYTKKGTEIEHNRGRADAWRITRPAYEHRYPDAIRELLCLMDNLQAFEAAIDWFVGGEIHFRLQEDRGTWAVKVGIDSFDKFSISGDYDINKKFQARGVAGRKTRD